jgi:hypothetical protein
MVGGVKRIGFSKIKNRCHGILLNYFYVNDLVVFNNNTDGGQRTLLSFFPVLLFVEIE